MPATVPIAGVLTSLGLYGVVMAVLALKYPKRREGGNLKTQIEWVGVLCVSLIGMVGTAITLAVASGRPVPHVVAFFVVGALGVAFFKMLEITPIGLFVFLIDTRHFSARVRRGGGLRGLKQMWEDSKIDGNVVEHQENVQREIHRRRAIRGAISVATLITLGNAYWMVVLGDDVLGLGALSALPIVVMWIGLVFVLTMAGAEAAERAPGIDWRRPF